MKLWHSPTSPFVRKVLILAHERGLSGTITLHAAAASPVRRDGALAAANPLGKIPALETGDAGVLVDSRVICQYLDARGVTGSPLIPPAGPARWRVLTLEALADGLTDAAVLMRYETALRPPGLRWEEWVEGQTAKVRGALAALESDAMDVLDGPLTLAQCAVGAALGYLDFRFAELDWRDSQPALAAWWEAFGRRESVRATAPTA